MTPPTVAEIAAYWENQVREWSSYATHSEDCWQHHWECAITRIAREYVKLLESTCESDGVVITEVTGCELESVPYWNNDMDDYTNLGLRLNGWNWGSNGSTRTFCVC